MNGGGGFGGSMPKSLTCYICGRGYGTRSLGIHLKTCIKKFEQDQSLLSAKMRKKLPNPPRGLMELLAKPNITHKDIEDYNRGAFNQYNTESLNSCNNCGRSFGDKAFANHSKVCSAEKPFKPLGKTGAIGGTQVGKVASRPTAGGGGSNAQPIGGGGGKGYNLDNLDDGAYDEPQINMVPCAKCGRKFAEDRISKHQKVCKENAKPKKVKMFHKPITEQDKAKLAAGVPKGNWKEQSNALKAVKPNLQ